MGGEGKDYGHGTPQPAAHLPFFSPLAAHHSAKRASGERNLPICGVRFAICEVRCMIGVLYSLGEAARTECNSHHPQCGDGDACARYRHLGEMLPTASPHIRVPQG